MNAVDLITHPEILRIMHREDEVIKEKRLAGYNLFTISSYTYYLENFHSDIIASLLNPMGLHQEGYKFLQLFLNYLNKIYSNTIDTKNYNNTTVLRERGRLDIWIRDESSKHCFFIENKINDASDRDDQLLDYYNFAINNGYFVDAVVYISKDGNKVAPGQSEKIQLAISNIAAFNNKESDLLSGWLKPSHSTASNEDSKSFLFQYCKLITHLSNSHMENDIKEDFYQFVSKHKSLNAIAELSNLIITLPNYRAQKFGLQTKDFEPFKNRFPYHLNYWIFEKYIDGKDSYKLDVFFENDGGAKILMWNTVKRENGGYETVESKLKQIGLRERFNGLSLHNGLTSEFHISDKYETIEDIDKAVLQLVQEVFQKLNQLDKSNTV